MATWTEEQFKKAVSISRSYQEVIDNLGLTTYGANYRTIKKHILRLNLDTSHFRTIKEAIDYARSFTKPHKLTNEEMFTLNTVDRKHVKNRIIEQNLIPYKCEKCGITEWKGKLLSLHLDHKNGNNKDNHLENLRFLCPNCHSLTDSYCGKNIRLKNPNPHVPGNCLICGKEILWSSKVCRQCQPSINPACKPKIDWGTTEHLIQVIKDSGSFCAAARKLGVSDNAIRKQLKRNSIDPKSILSRVSALSSPITQAP